MGSPLAVAVEAFESMDVELVGGEEIPSDGTDNDLGFSMDHVRRACASYDTLIDEEGRVMIPLHEPESPNFSGKYLLYSEGSLFPAYAYRDIEQDTMRRIDADDIGSTGLPWLVRFWTDRYDDTGSTDTGGDGPEPAVIHPDRSVPEMDPDDFYEHLQRFVTDMREMERVEHRSAFDSIPYNAYRSEYGGIPVGLPVRYTAVEGGGDVCTIIVPSDKMRRNIPSEFGIYPENEVLIDILSGDDITLSDAQEAALPAEGIVQNIEDNTLTIRLLPERTDRQAMTALEKLFDGDSGSVGVAQLHNPVPFDREQAAIQATRDTPSKAAVLTGDEPICYDATAAHETSFPSLNEYQTKAAERALAAEQIHCIHGPPGTGKTRTLIALVEEFVDRGRRVLACAHSNQATDNLIVGTSTPDDPDPDSLHAAALDDELTIARAGNGSHNQVVVERYAGRSIAGADVVATTMSAAERFDIDQFDVAIVDEASQASVTASLTPFNAAERTILAGDHKQLPPYASSELEQREMEISLFEHLMTRYGDGISTLLGRQYRMNDAIASFPNREFYDGMLETASRNADWTRHGLPPLAAYDVAGGEEPARGHSQRNVAEAELAAEEVSKLLDRGFEPQDIGVITPYRGQIGAIRDALHGLEGRTPSVKIDTIDSFQGSERSAIIVSFVRSNEDGRTGFLTIPDEGERRLNVALTRAQHRLVLIGDRETLCSLSTEPSCVDTYRRLWTHLEDEEVLTVHEPGSA